MTFTNRGSAATKVSARDVLPANWQYVAGSATLARDGEPPARWPTPP